ncbi:hypothetical protein [Marinobacterium stanieri]|uniref:hypothetical protein n=1 Tax=Marinobacterium stanieri TaxID=49186 RepID=UPI0002557821|nr:hypothetical protein [Marinobacterium stanieri]
MQKRKLKDRPIQIEAPKGARCDHCFGSGVIRGAVSEYTCGHCGGLGLIEVEQDYFTDCADALASALIIARRDLAEMKRLYAKVAPASRVGSKID